MTDPTETPGGEKTSRASLFVRIIVILINIMPFFIIAGAMILAHESVGSPVFTGLTGAAFLGAYGFMMVRNRRRRAEIDEIIDRQRAEEAAAQSAVDDSDKPS